jgi:hypothetical protein
MSKEIDSMATHSSESDPASIESLQQQIQPQWREGFRRFVQTGKAEEGLLEYLKHDEAGKRAIEAAFKAKSDAFSGIAESLRNIGAKYREPQTAEPVALVSARMAKALAAVVKLPPDEENQAVERAASVLGASLGREGQERLQSMVRNLGNAVARLPAAKDESDGPVERKESKDE